MDDPEERSYTQLDEYILDYIYCSPIIDENTIFGPSAIKLVQTIKSNQMFEKFSISEIIIRSDKQLSTFLSK